MSATSGLTDDEKKKENMRKTNGFIALATAALLSLSACGGGNGSDSASASSSATSSSSEAPTKVEVKDIHGTVTVPVKPKSVVALDNRTFETLADWGVKLSAAPKDVMPAESPYVKDESVQNIGNHREPNLEVIAAANPDLVIVGQRFAKYYDQIKQLVPNASVVDFSFDVSDKSDTPGKNLVNGLKDSTTALGAIFDKNDEAKNLNEKFDKALNDAKAAYNGNDAVMAVSVSGGKIGYVAPNFGRIWGPLYEIFGWKPALEVKDATTDHKGDDISVEAIAESNPTWIFVTDRDAAVQSKAGTVPAAKDVIEGAQALANTSAVKEGKIVYAPADTYTNESIQTFTELFEILATNLKK